MTPPSSTPSKSANSTPISSDKSITDDEFIVPEPMTTSEGEVLCSDYSVHELPSANDEVDQSSSSQLNFQHSESGSSVLVNTALLARIELLEAEVRY